VRVGAVVLCRNASGPKETDISALTGRIIASDVHAPKVAEAAG